MAGTVALVDMGLADMDWFPDEVVAVAVLYQPMDSGADPATVASEPQETHLRSASGMAEQSRDSYRPGGN
jgi:hypothetical protein